MQDLCSCSEYAWFGGLGIGSHKREEKLGVKRDSNCNWLGWGVWNEGKAVEDGFDAPEMVFSTSRRGNC